MRMARSSVNHGFESRIRVNASLAQVFGVGLFAYSYAYSSESFSTVTTHLHHPIIQSSGFESSGSNFGFHNLYLNNWKLPSQSHWVWGSGFSNSRTLFKLLMMLIRVDLDYDYDFQHVVGTW